MYQALYRAYRPEVFDEMLGQEHIVKILKNQIATDSTSHAYLFCGTRGTGKTTTARLLAKGLNCTSDGDKPCGTCPSCRAIKDGTFIDVVEIDAASNNGVDNIRELRESVNYPPAVGRKKVYIIDEVHMLSSGAFNALLKTLEEPPEYVVFVLATTEVQKLPATILSRCMRLDFRRVPEGTLIEGMGNICRKIGIDVSEDALRIIASNADGSVRDGLSILDQCISGGEKVIGTEEVLEFLGASGDEDFIELTEFIRKRKTAEAIEYLAHILSDGKDVRQFMKDWINHYRNLLMTKYIKDPRSVINMSEENIDRIRRQSSMLELEHINAGILELSRALNEARMSTQPRILLELAIVKLCLGAGEIRAAAAALKPVKAQVIENAPVKPAAPTPKEEADPLDSYFGEDPLGAEFKVNKEESVVEAAVPVSHQEQSEEFDLETVWSDVFSDGEKRMGSFYMIGQNGRLVNIGQNDFTIAVTSAIGASHIEKNRAILEELMEKHTGRRRSMIITNGDEDNGGRSIEEIAAEAGQLIGIPVEIE